MVAGDFEKVEVLYKFTNFLTKRLSNEKKMVTMVTPQQSEMTAVVDSERE